jgi:hypothetical protein
LSRGAGRIFEKFVVVSTGIEPKTQKIDEALEEIKVVDLFELRKRGR